jgi:exodeoxyribonuclease-5
VHRQAAGNPIVRLSMQIRAGEKLALGDHGAMRVVSRNSIDAELVKGADQVLVGLNKTRRAYNKRLRELLGHKETMPEVGEKLVCLRNDKTKGLLNGAIFKVVKASGMRQRRFRMLLAPEDSPGAKGVRVGVLPAFFEGTEESIAFAQRRESDEFDFGYALTVHKAQGSQWDHVVLFDESWAFRENRERWLYTGVTRAAKSLTVVV